jgi:arsenite methyltransferase
VDRLRRRRARGVGVSRAKLAKAGFEDIDVEPTRVYTAESARELVASARLGVEAIAAIDGKFISAFVRARKPLA